MTSKRSLLRFILLRKRSTSKKRFNDLILARRHSLLKVIAHEWRLIYWILILHDIFFLSWSDRRWIWWTKARLMRGGWRNAIRGNRKRGIRFLTAEKKDANVSLIVFVFKSGSSSRNDLSDLRNVCVSFPSKKYHVYRFFKHFKHNSNSSTLFQPVKKGWKKPSLLHELFFSGTEQKKEKKTRLFFKRLMFPAHCGQCTFAEGARIIKEFSIIFPSKANASPFKSDFPWKDPGVCIFFFNLQLFFLTWTAKKLDFYFDNCTKYIPCHERYQEQTRISNYIWLHFTINKSHECQ